MIPILARNPVVDAGHDAPRREQLGEGGTVLCRLPDGFVKENHAADERIDAVAGDQQLAVGAAVFLGTFRANAVETFLDRRAALVDGEDALAVGNHGVGNGFDGL